MSLSTPQHQQQQQQHQPVRHEDSRAGQQQVVARSARVVYYYESNDLYLSTANLFEPGIVVARRRLVFQRVLQCLQPCTGLARYQHTTIAVLSPICSFPAPRIRKKAGWPAKPSSSRMPILCRGNDCCTPLHGVTVVVR